ncbi:MAG: nucleoside deaminase [Bacilli bacterium]|nr:nucleoside deaminase [Bacilli bacterium]MDD4809093.1 nucleoside deaminase [Bacilli bacterium]
MEKYMKLALIEANKSYIKDDVPVGAVIVKNDKVIAKAHNKKEKNKTATHHAEILAIEEACKKLKSWHLDDCILYVTLEPCLMCFGAILESRIKKIVYATNSEKFGFVSSTNNILKEIINNYNIEIVEGLYKKESQKLLSDFFKTKRK